MTTLQEAAQRALNALADAGSVCASVSMSHDRRIMRDGCTMFLQTQEWCEWLETEVGPAIETAADDLAVALASEPQAEPASVKESLTVEPPGAVGLSQILHDPENQPSQYGTVPLSWSIAKDLNDSESDAVRMEMARLLDGVALALRGEPGKLKRWSWHDLPDRAAAAITAIDVMTRAAALATQPAAPSDKWEGAEEWMPLAWELCANECGEDACESLIWEGGPIPEPWGERWLKYEDQAKDMIAMVRKHVPSLAAQPVAPGWLLAAAQKPATLQKMSDPIEFSARDTKTG